MELSSSAFAPNADIPTLYTCEGRDQSPPLAWSGVPAGTKSLALIVDDPDVPDPAAPKMTWVPRVLYNLPPDASFPVFEHPGTEFLYMLEGRMEYRHGQHTYLLTPGDALTFRGEVPHGPEKLFELPIRFLATIVYPMPVET